MTTILAMYEGPLAVFALNGGETYVLPPENTLEAKRQADRAWAAAESTGALIEELEGATNLIQTALQPGASMAELAEVQPNGDNGWALPITDLSGRTAGGWRPDGTFEPLKFKAPALSILVSMLSNEVAGRLLASSSLTQMLQPLSDEQGGGFAVIDQSGRMAARVDLTGLFQLFKAQLGAGSTVADLPSIPLPDRLLPGGLSGHLKALPPETGYAFAITDQSVPPKVLFGVPVAAPVQGNVARATFASYADRSGNQSITVNGDSMPAGIGAPTGQDIGSIIRNLTGRTVKNRAVPGQTWGQIGARQGADPCLVTVSGNMIPASGSVAVTTLSQTMVPNFGDQTYQTIIGTVAGVEAALIRDVSTGNHSLLRTTSGVATECPPGTPFLVKTAADDQQDTQVLWGGRNDISQGFDLMTYTVPKVENAIRFLGHGRFVIIGVCTLMSGTEDLGSADLTIYRKIVAYNNYMAARWGGKFFDVRRYLIDRALTDAGIAPTSDDLADISLDRIPTRFAANNVVDPGGDDLTHLKALPQFLIGTKLVSILNAKGL